MLLLIKLHHKTTLAEANVNDYDVSRNWIILNVYVESVTIRKHIKLKLIICLTKTETL
jgi:hypothetical protein